MTTDGSITCPYASTMCVPEKVYVVCTLTKGSCGDTVRKGECKGKLKEDAPVQEPPENNAQLNLVL